jgi:uncharacterized membrane protein HdeD (DUF308 family)
MDTTAAPPRATASLWWLPVILGCVDVVLGVAVLAWPEATIVVLAVLLGLRLVVAGAVRLARAVLADDGGTGARALVAIVGVLYLFVGLLCFQDVMQTAAVLVVLVGLTWLLAGFLELLGVLSQGPPSRWTGQTWWDLVVGVVALAAGTTLLAFPEASVRTFALLLGCWLLGLGVLSVVSAFRIRAGGGG